MPSLDLSSDPVELTAALVDIASVSGAEAELADAVHVALQALPGWEVLRDGDAVVARTDRGLGARVMLAGHLDTVPIAENLPSTRRDGLLYGCGTSDMKAGVAVMLHAAATLETTVDLTVVCYDHEEVEASKSGLGRLTANHPDWLQADFGILLEPTDGFVEAGCQGTIRIVLTTRGVRAHSARAWLGSNAIHAAAPVLDTLAAYRAREVTIDGCTYVEGLNAVAITGGVAGNVLPDECRVTVNFRFAPDRTLDAALEYLRELFDGFELEVTDAAAAALPGLDNDAARGFLSATGATPRAKYGWTDVSRLAAAGIPAVNFGPGDPNLAHKPEEHVEIAKIADSASALQAFLTRP